MFKYITNNIGEKMSDIWIIILILEGSLVLLYLNHYHIIHYGLLLLG